MRQRQNSSAPWYCRGRYPPPRDVRVPSLPQIAAIRKTPCVPTEGSICDHVNISPLPRPDAAA
jgi:hypothetical protein